MLFGIPREPKPPPPPVTYLMYTNLQSRLIFFVTDLIGRGFILWEPHLEVSKVLLGLLEMTCEADWWVA